MLCVCRCGGPLVIVLLMVKALTLVSYPSENRAPWINDLGSIEYRTPGKSTHGARPWDRESLNRGGALPMVTAKGPL